jgi:hypothetical protein
MCSCAPGALLVDLFNMCRVVALQIVKANPKCCVMCTLSKNQRTLSNDDQHHCETVGCGFCFALFVIYIAHDLV